MRNLIGALVLMPALALTACGGGGDSGGTLTLNAGQASAGVGREYVLGHGETLDIGRLSLEFTQVEDSRCGSSSPAVCVWEGNATILLSATNGQISQVLTLNSNSRFQTFAIFDGHIIHLRRLDPQPRFSTPPDLDEYTATLFIEGN